MGWRSWKVKQENDKTEGDTEDSLSGFDLFSRHIDLWSRSSSLSQHSNLL